MPEPTEIQKKLADYLKKIPTIAKPSVPQTIPAITPKPKK